MYFSFHLLYFTERTVIIHQILELNSPLLSSLFTIISWVFSRLQAIYADGSPDLQSLELWRSGSVCCLWFLGLAAKGWGEEKRGEERGDESWAERDGDGIFWGWIGFQRVWVLLGGGWGPHQAKLPLFVSMNQPKTTNIYLPLLVSLPTN